MSGETKVKVALPTGATAEGVAVQVDESTERWSEFRLSDGATLRAKVTIASAVRVDGQYDPYGNPVYVFNVTPVLSVPVVPERFRKTGH